MKKIINPGTVSVGNRRASVFYKIGIEQGRLSISGVVGPLPGGNCLGSCGQCQDALLDDTFKPAKGWDEKLIGKLVGVWSRWHLNDMRAECEHQRKLGWTYKDHHDKETYQGKACPVCGYHIGSSWLKEELPQSVIDFLESLPESAKTPAWV